MGSPGLLLYLTTNIVISDAQDDQAAKLFFCGLVIFIKNLILSRPGHLEQLEQVDILISKNQVLFI